MNKIQRLGAKILGIKAIEEKRLERSTSYGILNGNVITSADNRTSYLTNGYNINDTIYSVINLICEKVRMAPWIVCKIKDEGSLTKRNKLLEKRVLTPKETKQVRELTRKALEPYTGDGRLNDLIKYPNEDYDMAELVVESCQFKMLMGGRMLWAELLAGGANAGKPMSLWTIPYNDISIVASRTWPVKVLGYRLDNWGMLKMSREEVMHDKYTNPNYDPFGGHLFGHPPMRSALRLVDRSNSANVAANSYFKNGGPRVILSVQDERFDPAQTGAEAGALKKILQGKEYVGEYNSNKMAATGLKVEAVPIGLTPVELAIIESEQWDLRRFCNVFSGIPSQLLNDPENKTYNNQKEGEKALTTRAALPLLNSFRNAINRKLSSDWGYKDQNIYIEYDATIFGELQEDLGVMWTWVKGLPVPWRYKLDMMGLDYEEGQEGLDEVMIESGMVPIDSFDQIQNALNDQQGDKEDGDDEVPKNGKRKSGVQERASANGVHKELI